MPFTTRKWNELGVHDINTRAILLETNLTLLDIREAFRRTPEESISRNDAVQRFELAQKLKVAETWLQAYGSMRRYELQCGPSINLATRNLAVRKIASFFPRRTMA